MWQSPHYSCRQRRSSGRRFRDYYAASTVTRADARLQEQSTRQAAEQQRATVAQQRATVEQLARDDERPRATERPGRTRRLSPATYVAGEAAQAEGERFSTTGNLTAATQAYQQRPSDTARRAAALVKREQRSAADSGAPRCRGQAARSSSAPTSPAPRHRAAGGRCTLRPLPGGDRQLPRRDRAVCEGAPPPESAEGADRGATPSVPVAPSPGEAGAPNARAEIRTVLETYVRAIEEGPRTALLQQSVPA